jgi:hypothetical protein
LSFGDEQVVARCTPLAAYPPTGSQKQKKAIHALLLQAQVGGRKYGPDERLSDHACQAKKSTRFFLVSQAVILGNR